MKKIRSIFVFGNVIFSLVMLASYLAAKVSPTDFWGFQIIILFYPILFGVHLVCILFWLSTKPKWAWISIITIIIGWGHVSDYFNISIQNDQTETSLNMMTFNVRRFVSGKKGNYKAHSEYVEQLFDIARAHHVEIIQLQEIALKEKLFSHPYYPYHCYKEKGSMAIISHYPLANCKKQDFSNTVNGYLSTIVYMPKDTFQLINTHLQSNKLKNKEVEQFEKNKINKKLFWRSLLYGLKKYKVGTIIRVQEVQKLKNIISKSKWPVILTGDFNEVPGSYVTTQLTDILNDSFKKSGNGFGASFKDMFGTLRIDYILTDKELNFGGHQIIKTDFSDHHAVVARVILD